MPRSKPLKSRQLESLQLRRLRNFLNYSQKELADEFRVGHAAISSWEGGSRTIPGSILKLIEIYEIELGLDPITETPDTVNQIESTWLSRNLKLSATLGAITARMTGNSFLKLLGATTNTTTTAVNAAEKMANTMGSLKGLIMKAGQMLGYTDFGLSESVRNQFAQLHSQSQAVEFDIIKQTIQSELGDYKKHFQHIAPTPLGTGSIGQVHEAILTDGSSCAIKIQYPHILKMMNADLSYTRFLEMFGPAIFPKQDRTSLIQELKDRAADECDYLREGQMQTKLGEYFRDDPHIIIPKVYPQLTTHRLLAQEKMVGNSFQDFLSFSTQEQRNQAGETLFHFYFKSALQHGIVNCDPHPGNYLFKNDQIIFLDFGGTLTLTPILMKRWKQFLRSILQHDRKNADDLLVEMGYVPNPEMFNFEAHFKLMKHIHQPWQEPGAYHFTHEYLIKSWNLMFKENVNRSKLNLPREWVFLNRLQWGLYSILATMNVRSDFSKIMLPLIEND